jgi:hypothetical protein
MTQQIEGNGYRKRGNYHGTQKAVGDPRIFSKGGEKKVVGWLVVGWFEWRWILGRGGWKASGLG